MHIDSFIYVVVAHFGGLCKFVEIENNRNKEIFGSPAVRSAYKNFHCCVIYFVEQKNKKIKYLYNFFNKMKF